MHKKLLFLTSFVLVLSLVSISYAAADARMIKLDMNYDPNNDDANTQWDFTKFVLADSGKEVNNVVIDLGGTLRDSRRTDPCGVWSEGIYYPRAGEDIYRDFIFGAVPSGITITLYGLGVSRDCNVTIWAYDACSAEANRIAQWSGNGTHIFDTNFIGAAKTWPDYNAVKPQDLYKHAYHHIVTTDYLGRIILTSTRHPNSPAAQPFAFVNALKVAPDPCQAFVATKYAQRPVPFDGTQNVAVNTKLKWRKGGGVTKHDLYLGTDETAVTNATHSSHPGVLAALDLPADANTGYDPYGATGFLKLDKTYYWCVDENSAGGPWQGEVWSFGTSPYSVNDDFDSYPDNATLKGVWTDYWTNGSCAEVFTEQTTVRSVQSLMYTYTNKTYTPYYAEANATVASLGLDPNWSEMDAKALSLWFYGDPCNPISAHDDMYIKLVDSATPVHSAKVFYSSYGDMTDLREESWHEWNIPLADFSGVNMGKVAKIIIGFGDGTQAAHDGIMYFEDIRIYTTRCVLVERSADIAQVDYDPAGVPSGDCIIDYGELTVMANGWLAHDQVIPTKNPNDVNLVLYYPLNEGDGNVIYPAAGSGGPAGSLAPWTGTTWNRTGNDTYPIGTKGIFWSTDHVPGIGGSACLYCNGDYGSVVSCGTYGQLGLGLGNTAPDVNKMTLSCWTKFLGPRTWDGYLLGKSQGLLGKRGGWSDATVRWMLEVSAGTNPALALRHGPGVESDKPDLYTAGGRMLTELGRWSHLAATLDGNTATLYINGGPVNSGVWRFSNGPDPNIFLTLLCTMDINAWQASCPESYYGYIDEVRIYDRALEPNEIAYLADTTPNDGYLQIPVPSAAEIYVDEPVGQQMVNFKDFALVANKWLEEDMFP